MMKLFNNIKKRTLIFTLVVVFLSLLNACSDMLDKQPLGKLNEAVFTTKNSIDKLIACYSPLNGYINGV